MLIRFVVKNLFSFKEQTEFNLLPGRVKRLGHHLYQRNGIDILKLSALYGANGSGKSNLVRSISLLKNTILSGVIAAELKTQKFKLSEGNQSEPVELAIEFFAGGAVYYYTVSIDKGLVDEEYFSVNDEQQKDQLIFHRVREKDKSTVRFADGFESTAENKTLKKIIETDLLKPHQLLFTLLNNITNDAFKAVKTANTWFDTGLTVIFPDTKPRGLVLEFDAKPGFTTFANNLMRSYQTGVSNLKVEVKSMEEYFGKDNQKDIDRIKADLSGDADHRVGIIQSEANEEVIVVNDQGKFLVKRLVFEHKDDQDKEIEFRVDEESDGTKRLLEYLPAINSIIEEDVTFIIDEIERSIHPLIIKEILTKLAADDKTKGQLIFTTHESNLLDQDIFRIDEIWFSEKSILGATKLYPLSDFKEHNTIDIRKGYLNGRYGAIPFLGNLRDLNWHTNAETE